MELKTNIRTILALTFLLLAPVPSSAETVLGVYIFHRHGDRTSKSTPPTALTPLGADQVYQSGLYYRSQYVAANGASKILALSSDVAVNSQLSVTSPIDTVLQNSAQVFLQGLYPPTAAAAETLANGTVTGSPLGGYQYIPVNGVTTAATASGAEDNTWLQSGSGCDKAVVSSNSYFSSRQYLETLESTRDFYASLVPAINRTFSSSAANFKNAYAIYDLIAVAEIHNASYPSQNLITPEVYHQLATRADQHEWGLAYNASEPVRAIAGSVLAAQVLAGLNRALRSPAASATATRMTIQFGAYATFSAFFGLAGLDRVAEDFTGVVEYASSLVFELVTNATAPPSSASSAFSSDDLSIRFRFSNGTAAPSNPPREFPLFGRAKAVLPWPVFAAEMGRIAVGDTAHWCALCGSTTGACASNGTSGSGVASGSSSGGSDGGSGGVTRPVAGVIGALVTLVVILGVQGLVMAVGGLRVVKKHAAAARGKAAEAGGNVGA